MTYLLLQKKIFRHLQGKKKIKIKQINWEMFLCEISLTSHCGMIIENVANFVASLNLEWCVSYLEEYWNALLAYVAASDQVQIDDDSTSVQWGEDLDREHEVLCAEVWFSWVLQIILGVDHVFVCLSH